MNPNKAFRKFGRAVSSAPAGASFVVGLVWIERKGWRVAMSVHTSILHLNSDEARRLADIYDRQHAAPEWHNKTTGLEWVALELRALAAEAQQKNNDKILPDEVLSALHPEGSA